MIIGIMLLSIFGYVLLIAAINYTYKSEEEPDEDKPERDRSNKKI